MEITAAVASLGALAQESRLQIFRALVQAGPNGRAVGEIMDKLGLPGPTLSFHLAQLKGAGLVRCQRDGRSLIYSADYEAMSSLVAYLLENCCAADSRCAAPSSRSPAPAKSKSRGASIRHLTEGDRHEASSRSRRRQRPG
jgi:ArsR family transcriptional regulator